MRRAIAATVMGGLVLGGAAATPAFAAAPAKAPGKAHPAALAKQRAVRAAKQAAPSATTAPALRTVVYQGYAFQVPASWPVYRLDEHPQTCVRYDVHAVYLGTPGGVMDCPAGLAGRTQTVSFIPAGNAATGPGGASPGEPAQPGAAGGTELKRLPAVRSAISQNAAQDELEVVLGATGAGGTVLGTYGTTPVVIEQVLSTLHLAPAGARPTRQAAPAQAAPAGTRAPTPAQAPQPAVHPALVTQRAAAVPARAAGTQALSRNAATAMTYPSWRGVPSDWPAEIVQPPTLPAHPVRGFDTCTAPSLAAMRAWRRGYTAVGAYIGGVNAACAYGNLSASWIRSAAGLGWEILPTYVGPQAPCWNGGNGVRISPTQGNAAEQGNAAGVDALNDARHFGLAPGSPVYYDLEAYVGGTTCKQAVLTFLGAWDRRVAAAGYLTAVYSSRDSGIANIAEWTVGHNKGFTPPDAIWIALWDGVALLNDGRLPWPLTEQSKQYTGDVTATFGGIKLNIDQDIVGGPVAR